MSTHEHSRRAHELVDAIKDGYTPDRADVDFLRSFLPELPKQKTLEELIEHVNDVWGDTHVNEWDAGAHGVLEGWLSEFEVQLRGLVDAEPEIISAAVLTLPAGMRIAEHVNFGRVVVSPGVGVDKCHEIFYLDPGMSSGTDISEVEPDSLTFIDSEPAKPAHPEFLETEADYAAAPEGTIVACDDSPPCHKFGSEWSSVLFCGMKDDRGMSRAIRRVLRWGWGE